MEEKEFLKEHPSLKEKRLVFNEKHPAIMQTFELMEIVDGMERNEMTVYFPEDIHKTQLDKAEVKEVIDRLMTIRYDLHRSTDFIEVKELKKELGLVEDNRIKVESSNLDFVYYDEKEEELIIWFKNRVREVHYVYSKVPVTVFGELMKAESKGKFFQKEIRNKFDVEKID